MSADKLIPFNPNKSVRADAARNRRLLLDTAERLFEQQSVEDVTMSAIAKEAGVGKGTLYRNFTDKAELCVALLDEEMRIFQQQTLEHIHNCDNPLECLRWFLENAAIFVVKHSELLREAANQGGIDMLLHPAHLWWRQTIIGLLGRLNFSGDASYIADLLYIMLDVQTIRFQRHIQNYDLERIIAGLYMILDRLVLLEE
jgi:AcrR family transcriptional regulator